MRSVMLAGDDAAISSRALSVRTPSAAAVEYAAHQSGAKRPQSVTSPSWVTSPALKNSPLHNCLKTPTPLLAGGLLTDWPNNEVCRSFQVMSADTAFTRLS